MFKVFEYIVLFTMKSKMNNLFDYFQNTVHVFKQTIKIISEYDIPIYCLVHKK